jgi:uncharacterized protein YecE (DUF72 family)
MTIRVGPAGWDYPDWRGVVYPPGSSPKLRPLELLSRMFEVVEVNTSFYRIPEPAYAAAWAREVGHRPDFRFTAKLFQGFTHVRRWNEADAQSYEAFLAPLAEAGKLGAVLVQYPWSFRNTQENRVDMQRLLDRFSAWPLVVEVRHRDWWVEEFFGMLRERGVSLALLDQPDLPGNVGPEEVLTGPIACVRFHGRNAANWWLSEQPYYGARYDYLYSAEELEPWARRLARLAKVAKSTFAVMNNHYRGEAVVNGWS